ncbi:MAG: methyltransferase, partial [Bilophila wadsworthia]
MKDWTPSALLHASGMYWESCAIHAAVHLDVFTPLSGGPMTVTELADRTGCVPQSLDRLLTALCAMGLLIRQGETCELPPFSRDHLCRGNPGYLGHIVEHHRHLMPGWSKLDESVRENRPTRHRSSVDTEDTGERESFLMGMYNIANAQAERSVPHIDLSGRSHLLDLGGATGAYAIHFCRRNPGLSATVFDLPTTRPFAERVIADSGMADRISFAGGDFTTEDLPGGFDVAWLSQILHGAGFDESANIVRKAAQSLVPGGLLLIQEFILDDNRSGPQHPALFDLNMLVGTPDGQSYTRQELAGFMRNAGLEDIRRLPLD